MSRPSSGRERFSDIVRVTPCGGNPALEIAGFSDPGLARSENQDALGYRVPDDPATREARGLLFVVCDGIGTLSAGQEASILALESFANAYYSGPLDEPERMLRRAAAHANAELLRARKSDAPAGRLGTTLVAALLRGPEYYVLNVGDSRAYIRRDGRLRQISRDHKVAYSYGMDPGGRGDVDRRISRAMGTTPEVKPDVFGPNHLAPADDLLLCSDGLTTAVPDSTIEGLLGRSSLAEAAMMLVERAKTAGARDNVTVLLIRVGDPAAVAAAPAGQTGWQSKARSFSAGLTWADVDPRRLLSSGCWRTRRGALILLGWLLGLLALAVLIGWLLSQ
jgi:serine/threonine protein phosphatase PrpC